MIVHVACKGTNYVTAYPFCHTSFFHEFRARGACSAVPWGEAPPGGQGGRHTGRNERQDKQVASTQEEKNADLNEQTHQIGGSAPGLRAFEQRKKACERNKTARAERGKAG